MSITGNHTDDDRTPPSVGEAGEPLAETGEKPRSSRLLRLFRLSKWTLALIVLAAAAFIFRDRIFVTVDTGEVVVVYYRLFGGTQHNRIGGEGLHIIAPWDKSYRYVVRSQTLVQPLTVLSSNGLAVTLDAQIRFHPIPDMVPHLHRRFGPDYVTAFVTPQLKSSVQRVVGQFLAEEIYGSETGASVNRIFENTKQLIGGEFLEIEDVALFNIKLPEQVQTAIQNKVEAEQNALAAVFDVQQEREKSKQKQEEAKGMQEYARIVSGIPRSVLQWKGIDATLELAKSPNAKIVVIGAKGDLPLLLGNTPDVK
ncbi:MAG TPA: prohibitin family protein [Blastocatellia bacterium]|nr:prohibitin family protein [Blastocatellia bacterium]HMZ19215.1 prohibitin family protein [Blastocatellia bacterium]HNG33625.1 prohibitin family protein [Blastocatellia bacterium]